MIFETLKGVDFMVKMDSKMFFIEPEDPTEEDIITLYYDYQNNIMVDEDGFIIHDIFRYITPSELEMFKKDQEWMLIRNVELVWPEEPWSDLKGSFYNY